MARDMATEVLMAELCGRREIAPKRQLFNEARNDDSLRFINSEFEQSITVYKNNNFSSTVEHFNNAFSHIDDISRSAKRYEQGQALQMGIFRKYSGINKQLSSKFYLNTVKLYKSSEVMRVLVHLRLAPAEIPAIRQLKNNLVYYSGKKQTWRKHAKSFIIRRYAL